MKYPVLLVHGIGFHDHRVLNYWGRIPKLLEAEGIRVFYGNQDSHASMESNGRFLHKRIQEILTETKSGKVNIIAHSKGGLDCRWMIAEMDGGEHVASLTTISTPHHGSRTIDKLLGFPDIFVRLAAFCCDRWYGLTGDREPDSYRMFHELTTEHMEQFNSRIADAEGVYYQSYAFVMKHLWSDWIMAFPWLVVHFMEGANDGLVTPDSAMWGTFKGIYTGAGYRGISHCDEVDMRRRKLSRKKCEETNTISDITEFYCQIARELEEMGF